MESPNGTEFSPEIEDLEQTFESEIRLLAKMTEDEFVKAHNAYEKHSKFLHSLVSLHIRGLC